MVVSAQSGLAHRRGTRSHTAESSAGMRCMMSVKAFAGRILLAIVVLPALPLTAGAQGTSAASIAGVVTDASGGVLPGVIVEASSPVLIEKVRITVTNDRGEYRIIELRPGTYTVSLTMQGFASFKREGIELPPSFTATVNAELRVGGIEESVTVSGTTPLVDTQNVTRQTVLPRALLDAVPT